MKDKEKGRLIFINICFCVVLCMTILPLLMVAPYNYPSADDWSMGYESYQAIREGAGLGTVLGISLKMVARHYTEWEGRFAATFFASLQPGIWGEQYYGIVTWLMLGGLILGELVLFRVLFNIQSEGKNKLLWLPIALSTLIMQILYTPSIVESFYWYTGSVNYTFVFGLSMILLALFVGLGLDIWKGWKFGAAAFVSCVFAVMVGGNNFSASLSSFLSMLILSAVFSLKNKKALLRTWYVSLLTGGSLLACVLAPGNTKRLEGNFGGDTTGNAVGAVWTSLVRTFTNIYSWTNWKIVLMIVLILPFVWMAVKQINYDFKWPALFTLLSFGVYASQITATVYVDGTTGGGRMAAILYYAYHVWIVGNVSYWAGWFCRVRRERETSMPAWLESALAAVCPAVRRLLILYCAVVGIVLAAVVYRGDLKKLSSYKAYRDWRQGWAQQYALEWEERLNILRDGSITQVEFAPLSVYPETILYTDLQDEEGYIWVNRACARYYGKEQVKVVDSAKVAENGWTE